MQQILWRLVRKDRGFIDKQQLLELAEPLMKTNYGKYMKEVAEGL